MQNIVQIRKGDYSVWVDDPSHIAPNLSTPPSSVLGNQASTLWECTQSHEDLGSIKSTPPPVPPATVTMEFKELTPAMQHTSVPDSAKVDQAGKDANPPSYNTLYAFWQTRQQPSKPSPDAHGQNPYAQQHPLVPPLRHVLGQLLHTHGGMAHFQCNELGCDGETGPSAPAPSEVCQNVMLNACVDSQKLSSTNFMD